METLDLHIASEVGLHTTTVEEMEYLKSSNGSPKETNITNSSSEKIDNKRDIHIINNQKIKARLKLLQNDIRQSMKLLHKETDCT